MSKSEQVISLREHLSAVLDDEAGKFEQLRVLDELSSDGELCQKLSCYALIGESMRAGELESKSYTAGPEFLANIHADIDNEENFNEVQLNKDGVAGQSSQTERSWLKPIGGFAMAASLAAIAFLGVQNNQLQNQLHMANNQIVTKTAVAAQTVDAPSEDVSLVSDKNKRMLVEKELDSTNEQYITADAKTRSMLKRYVDSHMQHASTSAFVPSVRVIAYADYQ